VTRRQLVVLNGVNLDLLGERDPGHYGNVSLARLEEAITVAADRHGWDCICHQTNHEGRFVELLHECRDCEALIVNPGAWTHYSYAIHDALELVRCPVAEVHLSDISAREEWRRHSVVSDVVAFTISGKGVHGYLEAAERLVTMVGAK